MRKFVATAAIAASAAAGLFVLPAGAHAALAPAPKGNLFLCANTTPAGGSAAPGGAPVFFHAINQNNAEAISTGVQDGFCQLVKFSLDNANPTRVRVEMLTTSASSPFCGPAAGMSCESPQSSMSEMSWNDRVSSGRQSTNQVEVVIPAPGDGEAWVTAWTNSAW